MTQTLDFNRAMLLSLGLHVLGFALLTFHFPDLAKPAQQAVKVKLVQATASPKPAEQNTKKEVVPPQRTQQSAAPKTPPKPKPKPKPVPKKSTKLVASEPLKPLPKKEEAKKEDTPAPRPEKLDKTPDKKNVVNDKSAEMVETKKLKEDFLAALSFVDEIKASQPAEKPTQQVDISNPSEGEVLAIQEHVRANWSQPPAYGEERSASYRVLLNPDGTIKSARLTQGSGSEAYDQSLERAIYKSEPFPIPQGRYEAFKELELHFSS